MSSATLSAPRSEDSITITNDELYEIIDGQRVELPPKAIFSVWIASQLFRHLANHADAHGLGRALSEALFHLPAPVNRDRRPDVAFVSFQRWPQNRGVPRTGNAWNVIPNLSVEVVSPTDSAGGLEEKVEEYFRVGVELVWVVHPLPSKIYVYEGPAKVRVLTLNDELDGGSGLPGFRLTLTELFAEPAAEPAPTHGAASS